MISVKIGSEARVLFLAKNLKSVADKVFESYESSPINEEDVVIEVERVRRVGSWHHMHA